MKRSPWRIVLAFSTLLLLVPPLWSQPSSPHIAYVYPAGGKLGTTFQVQVGGQYLEGTANARVSGAGIEVKVLDYTRPLNNREVAELRNRREKIQEKKELSAADRKELAEIREKLAAAEVKISPALAEVVTLEIKVAADAVAGSRELRLGAPTGMSNPVVFDISPFPEVLQKKEYDDPEEPRKKRSARARKITRRPAPDEVTITLPTVINSQIMPGDVDRYRFTARTGQQLVFITRARALIPYLADAVPGWFQAALTLYDADGNEVAYNDDFRHHPDPVLAFKVPKDGEYVLEVKDALYRGRQDFVYRIEAGELPFITSVFPPGGQANTKTTVTLEGWNLPVSSLTLEANEMKRGIIPVSLSNGELKSNRIPFSVNNLPETLEQESNNNLATAQKVTLPIIINGRIGEPGDVDVFQFEGRAGQTVIAEVRARRLDSPVDSVLRLTDAKGKVVAVNDDQVDKGQGLQTHHADSLLQATLPADGTYYLHMADVQRQGSSAHTYRLRISPPRHDFELRVAPCSISARPGSTVAITVYAVRRDGFNGEINLALTYSPVDFALTAAKVPAGQDEVRVTLQVPSTLREKPVHLAIEGRAMVQGTPVVRPAVPVEDMMQAFAYHHLVPANEMMIIVSGKARARFPARLLDRGPVKIPVGGTALARLAIPRGGGPERIQLVLSDPPEGITLKSSLVNREGAVLQLHADGSKVRPGFRGNLIVEAYPESAKKPGGAASKKFALGTLPAIPIEIVKAKR